MVRYYLYVRINRSRLTYSLVLYCYTILYRRYFQCAHFIPIVGNVKSLSWMGLTRERWYCTRDWMSRLDINTCQTSIKTHILFSAAVTHIPGLSGGHKITTVVPSELDYESNLIRQN